MMPLALADAKQEYIVMKVGGSAAQKQHLADLGFVAGAKIMPVTHVGGSVIVTIKDTRVAIGKDLAMKIYI